MSAKHTPPPWEWVGNSLEGPEYKSVLEVQQLPERAWPEMQMGELVMCNEEGDRPLIAAAPELLEACESAVAFLQADEGGLTENERQAVVLKLLTTISKAEGQA